MSSSLLLFDSRNVAASANARLELGAVHKHPANPLFVEEAFAEPPRPWEARLDNVYPNVIYDREDGRFKCWYKSFIYDGLSNRTPPAQRPRQSYGESEREEGLLYAISSDGIRWEKPALGLSRFRGLESEQPGHAPAQSRAACWRRTQRLRASLTRPGATSSSTAMRSARRMAACFSADGLRWSPPVLWERA